MFVPVIIVVIFVNYWVDPANIFTNLFESRIARILLNNKNVKYSKINYDERKFQEEYINKLSERKKTIVIGSSRAMLLNSELINSNSFFNNSVSGAAIEDILAIFFMYYQKNLLPDTVFWGLDPWILNINNGQNRWERLSKYYYRMLDLLKKNNKISEKINTKYYEKYIQLISFSYFQSSLMFLVNNKFNIESVLIEINQKCDDEFMVKHIDGSICYNKKYRTKDQNEINNEAASVANKTSFYNSIV